MAKYIYGLAMPFNDSYYEYDRLTNTFKFETTNEESVTLWKEVIATIDHDENKTLGRTNDNLTLTVNPKGVFFKLLVNDRLGYEAYGRVSRKEIEHCSVTYLRRHSSDLVNQAKGDSLKGLLNLKENIIIHKHDEVLVSEVCLTSNPANDNTFCTTNSQDARLKGVEFSNDI